MKKLLAITAVLCLALFATSANAQANVSATLNLSANVHETASLLLSTTGVNFDVVNPAAITAGSVIPSVIADGNWKKGTTATLSISSTDLTGGNGGGTIPAASVQYKYASGSFTPLSNAPAVAATFTAASAGHQPQTAPLAFQLGIGSYNADTYTGVVTLTLQVM